MFIKKLKRRIIYSLPHKMAHSLIYVRRRKQKINWKRPTLYDEKIHWLMVYKYDSSYSKYVDKYQVRKYVKECGLEHLLIPLLGVYRDVKEIEYDSFPDKFILKATHGSGERFYEICRNKDDLNIEKMNCKMKKALEEEFCICNNEYQYEGIIPRIVCEELVESNNSEWLDDYKVVCANGRAKAILVCTNRDEGRDYFSIDWSYLEYVKEEYRSKNRIERPDQLEEMINAAEILSKPFPFARIDFYIVNNKLYFGEITLTPSSGFHNNLNMKGQQELGAAIVLPQL